MVLKKFCVAFLKACSKMEGSGSVLYLSLQIQQKWSLVNYLVCNETEETF